MTRIGYFLSVFYVILRTKICCLAKKTNQTEIISVLQSIFFVYLYVVISITF